MPREIKARFAGKLALNCVILEPDTVALGDTHSYSSAERCRGAPTRSRSAWRSLVAAPRTPGARPVPAVRPEREIARGLIGVTQIEVRGWMAPRRRGACSRRTRR